MGNTDTISEKRDLVISLDDIEKAMVLYDESLDTLYIEVPQTDAEEAILLENDIGIRIKGNRVVGIIVYNVSKRTGR
ncbi:conserved hypothetical protein [Ignisphaera aggregans DSM 17230]|uniref:DUF2283 domain-containing protein n=1 Tax=Ignisphaera aggregans (strain DSM 17230 / JCM 13409 / AQ1.S1) TaxID=583356 RepID=E0SNX4_IGNAA|nr:conserved hypothetical protein [Ignisphaera aggregans DSM 17230]